MSDPGPEALEPLERPGPPSRVLAVDLGTRRIGLAISDELGLTARPLAVLASVGPKRDARKIRELVDGLSVRLLLVGLPLDAEGEEGEAAGRARERGRDLARRLELPVEFGDESGSTVRAREALLGAGRSRRRRRVVDADAAAVILADWLQAGGGAGSAPSSTAPA